MKKNSWAKPLLVFGLERKACPYIDGKAWK
jgi:hypothetical protein